MTNRIALQANGPATEPTAVPTTTNCFHLFSDAVWAPFARWSRSAAVQRNSSIWDRCRCQAIAHGLRPALERDAMPFAGPSHAAVPVSNSIFHNCNTEIYNIVCDPSVQLYRHGCDSAHSSEAYAMTLTPNSIPMCHKFHFSNPSCRSPTCYRSNYWSPWPLTAIYCLSLSFIDSTNLLFRLFWLSVIDPIESESRLLSDFSLCFVLCGSHVAHLSKSIRSLRKPEMEKVDKIEFNWYGRGPK